MPIYSIPVHDMSFIHYIMLTLQLMVSIGTTQLEAQPYICKVNQVIDGNTIVCNNETQVRIWGINVPPVQPVVSKEEAKKNGGLKAKNYLESYVKGKNLTCSYKGMFKGGIVAQCIKDLKVKQVDIADPMLIGGYATEDTDVTDGYYGNPNRPKSH